jgi:hypothetical protein
LPVALPSTKSLVTFEKWYKISKFQYAPTTEELFKDLRGRIKYFEDPTAPTIEEWGDEI